jgi:hypothetical protein
VEVEMGGPRVSITRMLCRIVSVGDMPPKRPFGKSCLAGDQRLLERRCRTTIATAFA